MGGELRLSAHSFYRASSTANYSITNRSLRMILRAQRVQPNRARR
jgi:hypothetical protein